MLKLRNKEVKCFTLGGGAEEEMTCDKAATRFFKEILGKDLFTSSVRFPEEKLRIGSIPVPLQSEEENNKKAEEIKNPKDREAFKKYKSQYFGDKAEFDVWEYLKRIPETPPTVLLHNFDLKMFRLFTGIQAKPAAEPGDEAASKQAPKAGVKAASKDKKEKKLEELTNQEWDFFLLSSEYKAFIHIEVKAGKVSEFSNILLLL